MVVAWIRVEAIVMKVNGPFQANTLKAESCGFIHSRYEAWRERMLRKTEAPGRLLHPQPKEYPYHSLRWEEHGTVFSCILLVEGVSCRAETGVYSVIPFFWFKTTVDIFWGSFSQRLRLRCDAVDHCTPKADSLAFLLCVPASGVLGFNRLLCYILKLSQF